MFLMFATINIGAMATFALCVPLPSISFSSDAFVVLLTYPRAIPETKGRSLEEMDVIFGSVSKEQREADINNQERGAFSAFSHVGCTVDILCCSSARTK